MVTSYEKYSDYGNSNVCEPETDWQYILKHIKKIIIRTKQMMNSKEFRLAIYFLKQKLCGLLMFGIGVICPMIDGDATVSLVIIPLGIGLLVTKNRVMDFRL